MTFLKYIILIILSYICVVNSQDISGSYCNDQTSTKNHKILSNIDTLLTNLVQTASQNGFSAISYGKNKDQTVYGLAQCRGDISIKNCSSCIQDQAKQIRKICPTQTDARIWYNYCFLRYNTEDFRGKVDTGEGVFFYNIENVTEPQTFNKKLGSLMDQIETQAIVPKNKGLGKGESKVSPLVNVYALVQCTRDLSPLSCAQCLATAVGNFSNICHNKEGCRVLYSSCFVRYEIYPFYFPLNSLGSSLVVKGAIASKT